MDRTERFYKIEQLLITHHVVPITTFLEELEVSSATFKRDLEYLRDRMNTPIEWDRDAGGYRYASGQSDRRSALAGLWFNASEVHALLTMQHLLSNLGSGLLTFILANIQIHTSENRNFQKWCNGLELNYGKAQTPPHSILGTVQGRHRCTDPATGFNSSPY